MVVVKIILLSRLPALSHKIYVMPLADLSSSIYPDFSNHFVDDYETPLPLKN